MRLNFHYILLFILIFDLYDCRSNVGIDDESLVSQSHAEKSLGVAIFLKVSENYPSFAIPLPFNLSTDRKCNRVSYFKRKDLRNCEIIILTSKFDSTGYQDYFGKMTAIVRDGCKLEKQIFLDNSSSGEVNICGINGTNKN
jgi:hypothetical protein